MFSSEAITRNIRVCVQSVFVPDRSDPEQEQWFFAYRVDISNEGTEPVHHGEPGSYRGQRGAEPRERRRIQPEERRPVSHVEVAIRHLAVGHPVELRQEHALVGELEPEAPEGEAVCHHRNAQAYSKNGYA